jgi:hypothetical protein
VAQVRRHHWAEGPGLGASGSSSPFGQRGFGGTSPASERPLTADRLAGGLERGGEGAAKGASISGIPGAPGGEDAGLPRPPGDRGRWGKPLSAGFLERAQRRWPETRRWRARRRTAQQHPMPQAAARAERDFLPALVVRTRSRRPSPPRTHRRTPDPPSSSAGRIGLRGRCPRGLDRRVLGETRSTPDGGRDSTRPFRLTSGVEFASSPRSHMH